MKKIFFIFAMIILCERAQAFRPFILHSGKSQVHLLEYFDSESCALCEEQRKWIAGLKSEKGLWKKFIPLNFDIGSYGDYLKSLSLSQGEPPLFALDGVEWTWTEGANIVGEDKPPVVGELEVARAKYDDFEITFTPKEKLSAEKISASGTLIGSAEKSFSVIELVSKELRKVGSSYTGHIKLPMKKNPDIKSYGAAFWITSGSDPKPIQAVGSELKID